MSKPILVLDFDGVLHSYRSGWKGAYRIPDPPVPGAISALLRYSEVFTIAIYSSRSKNILGRIAMKRWLRRVISDHWETGGNEPALAECECWGDAQSLVNKFKWPWFKPSAFLTIDDRALTFTGEWPNIEDLKRFKPWNKK